MSELRIERREDGLAVVRATGEPVGHYVSEDPFKPHLHPLRTLSGRVVSASITHDHKHHKGLMYGLRTRDINFWEERVTVPGESVGRQRQTGLSLHSPEGDGVAFRQALVWERDDGSQAAFEEVRSIGCHVAGDRVVWSWRTELTALADHELIMSQYALPAADGRPINYHGLGLRFPRSFGGMETSSAVELDGAPVSFAQAMGSRPRSLTLVGAYDGVWPPPRAGVVMRQFQSGVAFVLRDPFAYLAMGPTNDAPRRVRRGEIIDESYEVEVFEAEEAA